VNRHRIHDAHAVTGVMEPGGERLAIAAGRFQARMDAGHALLRQPHAERREAGRRIRHTLAAHPAIGALQRDVEFGFRDVDTEHSFHRTLLGVASGAVTLAHAGSAHTSGLRYRATGRHRLSAGC